MKEELIVSLTADIKDLSNKLDKANTEINGFADKSAASTSKAASSFKGLGSELQNLVVGYISLQAATEAVGRAFSESIKLDSVKSALTQVLGSSELAVAQLDRLSQSADYLGLNFLDLATSYKSFAAAAISSGQTLESTNKIFDSVTKSAAVLKLSSEDVKLSLNALGQMFSKGSIQAEELRGQLGERLPGAVALLAKGLGVSTKELNKMLEQGQVLASDLPKLADELDKTYGDSITKKVNTLQSSVNELANTFTKSLSSGAVGNFFKVIVDGANRALTSIEYLYKFLSNKPGTNIAAVGFEEDFKKYQELSKKGLAKIDVNADQKKIATQQGEINSALEQNLKLTADATILYGNQSAQVVTLNKEYGWLVNQLTEVNKLIKVKPPEITKATNRGYNPALEMMQGAKDQIATAKELFNLYKESPKSLGLLGEEYVNNPFFKALIDGELSKQTLELKSSAEKLDEKFGQGSGIYLEDLTTIYGLGEKLKILQDELAITPIGTEKWTELNTQILGVQTTLDGLKTNTQDYSTLTTEWFNAISTGATNAFESAINGTQTFAEAFTQVIKQLIARLLAALAVAVALSIAVSIATACTNMIGGKAYSFKDIFKMTSGINLDGGGGAKRVNTGVSNNNSGGGSVDFEIRGDKLYGVLQNYSGRLDRLV